MAINNLELRQPVVTIDWLTIRPTKHIIGNIGDEPVVTTAIWLYFTLRLQSCRRGLRL